MWKGRRRECRRLGDGERESGGLGFGNDLERKSIRGNEFEFPKREEEEEEKEGKKEGWNECGKRVGKKLRHSRTIHPSLECWDRGERKGRNRKRGGID